MEFVTEEEFLRRKERNRKITIALYYKDPEKHREKARNEYWENRDFHLKRCREWKNEHPDRVRENKRKNHHKNKSNPIWLLKKRVRNSLGKALREAGFRKHGKTAEILGCDFDFFRSYIESKFAEGMCWKNHARSSGYDRRSWELDHIIPISSGMTEADIIRLSHYTNFQPLWAKENNDKSDFMPCGARARNRHNSVISCVSLIP